MNFGNQPESIELPPIREFTITRLNPETGVPEQVTVHAHTNAMDDGALVFVTYEIINGQPVPQRHRMFKEWIEAEERVAYRPTGTIIPH